MVFSNYTYPLRFDCVTGVKEVRTCLRRKSEETDEWRKQNGVDEESPRKKVERGRTTDMRTKDWKNKRKNVRRRDKATER